MMQTGCGGALEKRRQVLGPEVQSNYQIAHIEQGAGIGKDLLQQPANDSQANTRIIADSSVVSFWTRPSFSTWSTALCTARVSARSFLRS